VGQSLRGSGAILAAGLTEDPLEFHRRRSLRGLELRAVLIAPPEAADGTTRLQSVELYEDGLIVRWVALDYNYENAHAGGDVLDPDIRVTDDVGTEYEWVGGSASANMVGCRGESEFMPATPSEATALTVAAGEWRNRFLL
jgi:hypothetical protein